MNTQHLAYFLKIATSQSFSQTAELLYISPSALSKAMRNLEIELGFPLFKKMGRHSVLTEQGKIFYNHLSQANQIFSDGLRTIHEQFGVMKGRIRISATPLMCYQFLPEQIMKFKKDFPDVNFLMEPYTTNEILENVISGKSDIGFCSNYEKMKPYRRSLYRIFLQEHNLILITPRDHPLANKKAVDLHELAEEKFILLQSLNAGTSQIFKQLCEKAEIKPDTIFEAADPYSIIYLVSSGFGISILPDDNSLNFENVAVIRFKGKIPVQKQYMVWHKEHYLSQVAESFKEFIIQSAATTKKTLL